MFPWLWVLGVLGKCDQLVEGAAREGVVVFIVDCGEDDTRVVVIWLLWKVDAEDVRGEGIADYGLNFSLVELFFQHVLSLWDLGLPIILEVAMVWGHNLPEGFLNSSNLWLDYILARCHLGSDPASWRSRKAPVQLLFALPSRDVSVQVLCRLGWMTDELLLLLVILLV